MNTVNLREFNEELSKNPCPKHHQSAVLERFYYGKPKFSNVCCKEYELACAKLVCLVKGKRVISQIQTKSENQRT